MLQVSPILPEDFNNLFANFNNETSCIEAHFGFYDQKFHNQLIDPTWSNSVMTNLESLLKSYPHEIIKQSSRFVVEIDSLGRRKFTHSNGRFSWDYRKLEKQLDNEDWGIQINKWNQQQQMERLKDAPSAFAAMTTQEYRRVSYIDNRQNSFFSGFQIHLSCVLEKGHIHYEFYIETNSLTSLEHWKLILHTLYGWLLGARSKSQIISLKEHFCVLQVLRTFFPHIGNRFTNEPLNPPLILSNIESVKNHAVSVKLDSLRKIIVVCNTGIYLCSPPMCVIKVSSIAFATILILEGEYVQQTNTVYIYDVLVNQIPVTDRRFIDRYNMIPIFNIVNEVNFERKSFFFPGEQRKVLGLYTTADGLIFQSLEGYYHKNLWKWKPLDKLRVDFLMKDGYPNVLKQQKYVPFKDHIVKSVISLNNKIVECKWNPEGWWEPLRIRDDRSLPSTFEVANTNYKMALSNITFDQITAILV